MSIIRVKMNKDRSASGFLIIFGIGWAIFSSIFLLVGILVVRSETELYERLTKEGKVTKGIVTDLETDQADDSTSYYVYYEFKAPVNGDPKLFKDSVGVSSAFYKNIRLDQPLEIIYVASDPTISQPTSQFGTPETVVGSIFAGIGGLFMLIGLGIMLAGIKSKFAG